MEHKINNTHGSNILFLLTHQPDPRLVRQINFLVKNHNVFLIYFNRATQVVLNPNNLNTKNVLSLRVIENGKYFKRLFWMFFEISKIKSFLKKTRINTVIYNNLDALLLSKVFNVFYSNIRKVSNVMEIADLREILFGNKTSNKLFRYFDKIIMNKYVDKLIVTSPKYYEVYYSSFFNGNVLILENKPLESMLPKKKEHIISSKIRIGIIGGLNRGKPTKLLLDKYKGDKNIEIRIHGKGVEETYMIQYSKEYKNIKFFGAYEYEKDISDIYSEIDLIYAVYDVNVESLNTKVALPNKLYEAMYYQIPIIVSSGTYLAERVKKIGIGYIMNCSSAEDLENVINEYKNKKNRIDMFEDIQKSEYLGDNDFIKFEEFISLF